MDEEITKKAICLINETRVMTLAVSDKGLPWSSPVYFVYHDKRFYFFSNENSRHILDAKASKGVSASIFHDSDQLDQIFGLQMSGVLEPVSRMALYLMVVKKYLAKFSFIEQVFGSQAMENRQFFMEKFHSQLYCFCPDQVFLSDNSKPADRRTKIDIDKITG